MKKVEIDPVLIILGIIAALIVGIVTGAVSVGKFLIKKFKQLIVELRVAHKKELSDVKTSLINILNTRMKPFLTSKKLSMTFWICFMSKMKKVNVSLTLL